LGNNRMIDKGDSKRLLIKITHENIPQVKDRYPFLYLEKGRAEVDDSSIKWIDSSGDVVKLPIATISTILLGPGTSITHEAVKVLSSANCNVCWVGSDSLIFYAMGISPTSDTRRILKQASLTVDKDSREKVARRMFSYRFPKEEVSGDSIQQLMSKEGFRVRESYIKMAEKYRIGWKGRNYQPGNFELSDITNKILTACNVALYAIVTSVVVSLGYSPYFGFIHSGSPLPFIYDIADLYKEEICIETAFAETMKHAGNYDRLGVFEAFRDRVIEHDILLRIPTDIEKLFSGL